MYKITEINGVKTYNMSAGKTYNNFVQEARKSSKSLRYNEQFKRRIQLIQDFQFQIATSQVQVTRDQRYIVAAGIYGPQIKIFDTAQLSLKCLRGLDSQVVKFQVLSDDYSKIAMAQADRSVAFHAQYGAHYKTRIPHYPRDLVFSSVNANLCVSASANEVYRISLEQGKFLVPLKTDSFINSMYFNDRLNVLVCGGDQLEMWDFRQRERVCKMQSSTTISKVACDSSGLLMGMAEGSTLSVFDVRFDRKLLSLRSTYNEPINSIHFLPNADKNIVFSNRKQVKITDSQGKFYTSIEPDNGINMCTVVANSGMILAAHQDPKVGCYFIPQLGPAPKWVPYIENITEELEQEERKVVYDEYKFVSKQEVHQLGCQSLINTKMLKEYMHGYLMHLRLYNKLKSKVDAVDLKAKIQAQVDRELNSELPERIGKSEIKKQSQNQQLDDRFKLLSNPDFEINQLSDDYIIRHPNMKKELMRKKDQETRNLQKELRLNNKRKQIQKGHGKDKKHQKRSIMHQE